MTPLLPLTVVFILGILLQGECDNMWLVSVPLAVATVALCMRRSYVAIMSVSLALGFLVASVHAPVSMPDYMYGRSISCSGIVREHREYEGAQMIILDVDSIERSACRKFRVKCLIPSVIPSVDETDRLRAVMSMYPLEPDLDLPDEIDYDASLRRMGVICNAVIAPDSIRSIAQSPGVFNDIRRMRREVQRLIAFAPVSERAGAFLSAALTGDRSWLTPDTKELFSVTGIAHVLALSGLHVGVLSFVVILLLLPFWKVTGGRYGRMVITVVVLWVFAVMTGLTPSVVRAVTMATLFAVCTMLQRVWSPLNSLCATALVMLMISPCQIYSLGFMLTFFAVLSIVIFADKLNPFGYERRWLKGAVGYLCVSVAAMLGTGIVCACWFHVFPTYFIVTNIAVSLILPVLLGAGVILLVFNVLGFNCVWLGWVIDRLYEAIDHTATFVSSLPGAVVANIFVPWWMIAGYFITLALLALWLYRKRVAMLYASVIVGCFMVLFMCMSRPVDNGGEAYITRSAHETSMLIKDGRKLYMYTTAHGMQVGDVMARDSMRYRVYMMKRGIDGITMLDDRMQEGTTSRFDNVILSMGRRFVFVYDDVHVRSYSMKPDYVVVCRGFRGNICTLAETVGADTILLSRDLNRKRHDRYASELSGAGVPFRSLRDSKFRLWNVTKNTKKLFIK